MWREDLGGDIGDGGFGEKWLCEQEANDRVTKLIGVVIVKV
jgi:hypothetical protein